MVNQHDTFYELKNCTLLVAFVLDDVTTWILLFTGAPSQLRWGWGSPQIEKNKHNKSPAILQEWCASSSNVVLSFNNAFLLVHIHPINSRPHV
jgi:hypothetical protein